MEVVCHLVRSALHGILYFLGVGVLFNVFEETATGFTQKSQLVDVCIGLNEGFKIEDNGWGTFADL